MAKENKTAEAEINEEKTRLGYAELKEDIEKKVEEKKAETHAEKKEEKKETETWKEFIIPLRRKFSKTARYRRVPKAIRAIKEFLVRHMKVYDRNLKKVKLDKYLNEFIWTRGIRNPPAKIKVRAVIDGDFIRAELVELTDKLKFKKARLEKREKTRPSVAELKKEPEKGEEKTEEEKIEEKEKKAAVVEAGQKMEKIEAKRMKHEAKISKQPKHQRRMALAK